MYVVRIGYSTGAFVINSLVALRKKKLLIHRENHQMVNMTPRDFRSLHLTLGVFSSECPFI